MSPSQKLNEDSNRVWVCVEGKDYRIVTSWYTCITGTAEAKCEKVILEDAEISCTATVVFVVLHVTLGGRYLSSVSPELSVKSIDAWTCCSCLVDNTGPWDDNFGEEEGTEPYHGASTSQDVLFSGQMNVCLVCCIEHSSWRNSCL